MDKILKHIRSFSSTADFIANVEREAGRGPFVVSFCNAHAVNLAIVSPIFADNLLSSDLLVRDGSGVKIAMQALGMEPGANLNGTDAIPGLLHEYTKPRLALYGTQEPWLGKAAALLAGQKDVVAMVDGFQDDEFYLLSAKKVRPDIILLAMGMPKQERIARLLAKKLDTPCLIINGGAILDFMAERFNRAPLLMRKVGMEWLYRLLKEPKRLFGRYVIGNAMFLFRLGIAFLKRRGLLWQRREKPDES